MEYTGFMTLPILRVLPHFDLALAAGMTGIPDGVFPLAGEEELGPLCRRLAEAAEPAQADLAQLGAGPFARFWATHRSAYRAASARLGAELAARPRADLGALFGFDISLDLQHLGLRQKKGAARRVPLGQIAALYLYPSAFNTARHWFLEPHADGRCSIHLPVLDAELAVLASGISAESRKLALAEPSVPDASPVHGAEGDFRAICRALGDPSRFAMMEILAGTPEGADLPGLTGAELARRLGLSTPAVTHHLNILRRAGLIDTFRSGNSLQLRPRRPVFANLGELAIARLFKAGVTTPRRSRRPRRRRPVP